MCFVIHEFLCHLMPYHCDIVFRLLIFDKYVIHFIEIPLKYKQVLFFLEPKQFHLGMVTHTCNIILL